MKTYKYILLDWDGNLAKTLDIWLEACRAPLEKRGLKLSDEEIAESFGSFPKYIEAWGLADRDAIVNEAGMIAKQLLPSVELYPDALEVLSGLSKKRKKLALITTSPHENVAHLLNAYKIKRYFNAIVAYEDTKKHKPNPEPLDRALELIKGSKSNAVMIGDSDKDILAANNAGIDSILFYPPEHQKFYNLKRLKKLNPTHIVDDFKKILNLV